MYSDQTTVSLNRHSYSCGLGNHHSYSCGLGKYDFFFLPSFGPRTEERMIFFFFWLIESIISITTFLFFLECYDECVCQILLSNSRLKKKWVCPQKSKEILILLQGNYDLDNNLKPPIYSSSIISIIFTYSTPQLSTIYTYQNQKK